MLEQGEVSAWEITQACLDQIEARDDDVHAFLEVYADEALAAAQKSDERRKAGETLGVLDGIPLAIKDNLLVQGKKCTAGSKVLENYTAAYTATAVQKLLDQGAIILGKTNMDEFAMGSSTEHSAFGPTKNPRHLECVPGGSSGGSAAAVAAHMCLAALGTDTGGSIRQPASFCGTFGLKPTYGRVSRYGLIAMASSLDQIGPITQDAEDAGLLLSLMQGSDTKDQTTAAAVDFEPAWKKDLKSVRVGLPKEAWGAGIDDAVRERVQAAVQGLKKLGAEIKEVELPYADEALAVYYVIMPCEVSANLARFDGMRYGRRQAAATLFETYAKTRSQGLGAEVRRRILLGTFALSRGYYDAYYLQAKKVQSLIRRGYEEAFREVDVLLTPTTPTPAFKLGEKTGDPLTMYLSDIFTVGANVAGVPAISMPCGVVGSLPVGLHLIGKWFKEDELLAVAKLYELVVSSG